LNDSQRTAVISPQQGASLASGFTRQRSPESDPIGIWYAILGILKRRGWFMLGVFGGVLAIVVAVTLVTPKRYTAEVKLIAGNPGTVASSGAQVQTGLPVLNALVIPNTAQSVDTYVELLSERPVVERVRDDLKLDATIAKLSDAVKIKPVTNTNIISLSATWSDPDSAANIANKFASVFMARQAELVSGQATAELNFLAERIPVAMQNLQDAEARISAFATTHHIADLTATTAATVTAAAAIDAKINSVALEAQQANAQIASLTSQMAGMRSSTFNGSNVVENPVLAQLHTQLAQLQVQLDSAMGLYTDQHPLVRSLKRQIAGVQRQLGHTPATIVAQVNTVANPVYQQQQQLVAAARATSAGAAAELATLAKQRTEMNQQLAALPASSRRMAELTRQQKSAENVYNALQAKNDDLLISRTTAMSDVTITEPARAYAATKSPRLLLNVIVGAIVGLLLSLGLAFVVEWLDGSIREEQDVEQEIGLAVLASIPLLPSGSKGRLTPLTLRDAFQESHFQLVLAMRYSSDRPLRTVAITSPSKGDGKSTVAVNVAAALGEIAASSVDADARVLIIDADLRCPTLHNVFGVRNDLGLTDILIGRATLAECVRRTERPGVDVLTSGAHSPNPIKLLQSDRFEALLEDAQRRYVTIIVDSPALIPVYDAAILAAKADGTVMVVSAGRTDVRSARRALSRLESVSVNLIGTVVNCATKVDDYGDHFAASNTHLEIA
jgi:polysaccharide biosynthesis transport protein